MMTTPFIYFTQMNKDQSSTTSSPIPRRSLLGSRYGNKYAEYVNVCQSGEKISTGLPDSFVKVENQRLTINGEPFYFSGWNIWEVLEGVRHASSPIYIWVTQELCIIIIVSSTHEHGHDDVISVFIGATSVWI